MRYATEVCCVGFNLSVGGRAEARALMYVKKRPLLTNNGGKKQQYLNQRATDSLVSKLRAPLNSHRNHHHHRPSLDPVAQEKL